MHASVPHPAARRTKTARVSTTALSTLTAAAMALGLAVALPGGVPAARAAYIASCPQTSATPNTFACNITAAPVYTAGPLLDLINTLGDLLPGRTVGTSTETVVYTSGPPQKLTLNIDSGTCLTFGVTACVNIGSAVLEAKNILDDAANLYNTIAGLTFTQSGSTYNRYAVMAGIGPAAVNLADAYRAEISSVEGATPSGYTPFVTGPPVAATNYTGQLLMFLRDPLRPNGGLLTRFPGLSDLLGIDSTIPAAGKVVGGTGNKIQLNTETLDFTWAYDPLADFPETPNPFSLMNSLFAGLPVNLLGGVQLVGDSAVDIGLNAVGVLNLAPVGVINTVISALYGTGGAYYLTLAPSQLPILTPLRVPSLIVNVGLKAVGSPYLLGTPLADALQPAMKILVDTGYSDVVTPEDIANDPATYADYEPYDRTYKTSAIPTPFGSVNPLTPQEWAQVPGDVFQALIGGLKTQLQKPFFGLLVPTEPTSAAATAQRARVTASASAAVQTTTATFRTSVRTRPVVPTSKPSVAAIVDRVQRADRKSGTSGAKDNESSTSAATRAAS